MSGRGQSAENQQELQQFVQQQNQQAQFQQAVSKLTAVCWDKCIGDPSSSVSGKEGKCMSNCAARFLDTSMFVMNVVMQKMK
jgi:import inner membrane translocase subunit TIM8